MSTMNAKTIQSKIETATRKHKYKELIEQGTKVSESLENADVLDTFKNILDIVKTCENLSANFVKEGKIENAADYLMDAQILKMSHDLMQSSADKMGNSDFSEDEFITALNNLITIESGEINFDHLSELAVKCCRTSQFCLPLLGTFDIDAGPREPKIRKERLRHKNQVGTTKAPENVKQLTKNDQGAEKINIVRTEIQRVCRQRNNDCLPYYELVCNPENFMKSVDVAFQISFLVRDGFLGLKKVDNEPHVYLVDPDPIAQHNQRGRGSDTVQCVMTLDTKLWKEKIEKHKIRTPLLALKKAGDDEEENGDEQMESD